MNRSFQYFETFWVLAALSALAIFSGCTSSSVELSSKAERALQAKRQVFTEGDLFRIFESQMAEQERDALTFLYAYMPTNDLVDKPGEFYLANVRAALRAREELPWGASIPDREWRHFVLPLRVNNEALDSFRTVLYAELKARVERLSLYDAVLEVNRWCHEHVAYMPSDSRTSSPLATLRTAYGRCGEESTLLVAALRTVGIPARQVYTPRWAHTDDNHAWVEAWVDGQWYFLGACEPEPVLNLGWFNAPVSRAMLVHTKVFGDYDGPEEVMSRTATYTEINVIGNYARTASIQVEVVDTLGRAVPDACVEFKVYNYGEFYSVATKHADEQGRASLTAGCGDMLLWASHELDGNARYGMRRVSFGNDSAVQIALRYAPGDPVRDQFTIVPPREQAVYPEVSPEQRQRNGEQLVQGDSIRNSYVATFSGKQMQGLDARGNWQTINQFVDEAQDRKKALALLRAISAKDLRDVQLATLRDHLEGTTPNPIYGADPQMAIDYIYNPRVANEPLVPYKRYFAEHVPSSLQQQFRASIEGVRSFCMEEIASDEGHNPLAFPIHPIGVWEGRRADARSRGVFFVSLARAMGWAARIDAVTAKVQYYADGQWRDVLLAAEEPRRATAQSELRLEYTSNGVVDNPQYYHHFTLSKFREDGRLQLLTYDEGAHGLEEGTSWSATFRQGTPIDSGAYLLVSGSRLANGSVLVDLQAFSIGGDRLVSQGLVMRRDSTAISVIGSFDAETRYAHLASLREDPTPEQLRADSPAAKSILSTTGRGYYILGILGAGEEPTSHALRDLMGEREMLEEWGQQLVLLFATRESQMRYRPQDFPSLPRTVHFGLEHDGAIRQSLVDALKLQQGKLPIFIVADTFNRVVFVSQGYTIGLGRQLRRVITGLEAEQSLSPTRGCSSTCDVGTNN